MSATGEITLDGVTSTSNTLTSDQMREQLAPEPAAESVSTETPSQSVGASVTAEPIAPASETPPKGKRYDPTKDPEVRISKATYEREEARREAAKERQSRETLEREFREFKAKHERPAEPAKTDAEPTFEDLLDKHKNASDPYAAAIREQTKNDLKQEMTAREQAAQARHEQARREHAQAQHEQGEQARIASFGQKLATAFDANPDLHARMASTDLTITKPMQDAIIESDAPDRVIAHLLANPAEVERIAGLAPLQQFRAMARLEVTLDMPAGSGQPGVSSVKKSAASAPISPVGGGHAAPADGEPDPKTCSAEEFDAYWNKKERESRMAGARR